MNARPYHQSLHPQNFTAFQDVTFEFVPGVNVFVGENGTGKTHVMKAMYAIQKASMQPPAPSAFIDPTIRDVFQTGDPTDLIRLSDYRSYAEARGRYGDHDWDYAITVDTGRVELPHGIRWPEEPVFIPAIDMMGHTKGFLAAYNHVFLDFDLTCRDIVSLLELPRRNGSDQVRRTETLAKLLGGSIEQDKTGDRFYLTTQQGRLAMPLVAEGFRKIATLVQLELNGWLPPGATLFWDEPEVNLNPSLMEEVVGALLALARSEVQVFLATHSYVILREIEVQARKSDSFRFFSLSRTDEGVKANPARTYLEISPNAIERQYTDLYDRNIEKRL